MLPRHHQSVAREAVGSAVDVCVPNICSNSVPHHHRSHTSRSCLNVVRWHFCFAFCSKPEHHKEFRIELVFSEKPVLAGFVPCVTFGRQRRDEERLFYNQLSGCNWSKAVLLLTFCNLSIMSSMLTSAVCSTLLSICTSQEHSSLFFSLNTIQALSLSSISCLRRDTYG